MKREIFWLTAYLLLASCSSKQELNITLFQTSKSGDKLTQLTPISTDIPTQTQITIYPDSTFQTIEGFGGAFTESSAYLLNQMSKKKQQQIVSAYFSDTGSNYTLTRTHINSCDFSLKNYAYDTVKNDTSLQYFDISEDKDDIIPMIKTAQKFSKEGFKIIASPWTAPPWMKDNNDWKGGKLLKKYYKTWAKYFTKYIEAYSKENIPIWAITVENEPLGNNSNWESMHYTAHEMADFVKNYLAPQLAQKQLKTNVLIYDQNKGEEMIEWSDLLRDSVLSKNIYGLAVHWYMSTVDWFPSSLQYTHNLAPQKHIIHTEACIDAEVPKWKNDDWYWSKDATDWGWDWAAPEDKKNHPKYVPVYRYANDIIGCLNNWVEGWVDWNMVLDHKGGPNWANNWCIAPVIVNPSLDEVYYTPLYYVMAHFSKYIRPDSKRIGWKMSNNKLHITAVKNKKNSTLIVLNQESESVNYSVKIHAKTKTITIPANAIQTLIIED